LINGLGEKSEHKRQIKGVIKDSLDAKTVSDLYKGDIKHRGVEHYLDRAFNVGKKLI
jgi:hypothetical protein